MLLTLSFEGCREREHSIQRDGGCQAWCFTPVIPAFGRPRQKDLKSVSKIKNKKEKKTGGDSSLLS
jgi:hypothetical protein